MPRTIAIIPARKGSQRLPRKNALEIEPGISLVQHAINCARGAWDAGIIDHVAVLTDDVSLRFDGASLIHEPADLAGSTADISAAVAHATEIVERGVGRVDYVVTLQPAVLARSPLIVKRVVEAVISGGLHGAVTVARTLPWQWTVADGVARNAWHPGPYPRSNTAPEHLVEVNAVQVASRSAVADRKRWGLPLVLAELPEWAAALDVDEPGDLIRARDMWAWARPRLETCEPIMHHAETIQGSAA